MVLGQWLRDLTEGGRPSRDETVWVPLRRIGEAIERKGIDGISLPAARRRLLGTMGKNQDGIPFEELSGYQPACDTTKRRLRLPSVLRDGDAAQADPVNPEP
ncbi:hypothetical protein [Micromonospora coerulea]|uniref:hypothetical protein n=1 Tax=Micromonospora coerulea TaxID=47856 RepID=UPI001904611D|nr:hypothetical protein [Micromonospora veneta]